MDSDEATYIQRLIGQPWERRGVHCWALVAQVQMELFGREVPLGPEAVPGRVLRRELMGGSAEAHGWQEVEEPEHGAVARMHRIGGRREDLEHAGVYLDYESGAVLHTDQPHGVVLDSLPELRMRGWIPRFFVPKE